MSVLLQFAIFPTDKGASVSEYVSKAVDAVSKTGFPYELTSMCTIVETDTLDEALSVVSKANCAIEPFADRVYITMNIDIRNGKTNMMKHKVDAVMSKLGNANKH